MRSERADGLAADDLRADRAGDRSTAATASTCSALEWGERRLANVHKLLRLARRFEAGEGRDLRGFLDHVAYLQRAGAAASPTRPSKASSRTPCG